jgi:dTDP-4-dehydrorhamnose reductase
VYGLRGSNFLLTIRRLAAHARRACASSTTRPACPTGRARWRTRRDRLVARPASVAERAGLYHLSAAGNDVVRLRARDRRRRGPAEGHTDHDRRFSDPAARPAYGVLASSGLRDAFGLELPDWRATLASCIASPVKPPERDPVG